MLMYRTGLAPTQSTLPARYRKNRYFPFIVILYITGKQCLQFPYSNHAFSIWSWRLPLQWIFKFKDRTFILCEIRCEKVSTMASSKLFSVVHFEKENKFCVVPCSWLTEDRAECHWPGTKTKNPSSLQLDPNSIPEPNWKKFAVKYIKSYGKTFSIQSMWKANCFNIFI